MRKRLLLALFVSGLFCRSAVSQDSVTAQTSDLHPAQTLLDVHTMTTWLRNDGFFPWEYQDPTMNGTYPKGMAGVVFTQGILWGGILEEGSTRQVRVNGSTYDNGLQPGRVIRDENGNVIGPDDPDDLARYHVWRVHRNWADLDYTLSASHLFDKPPAEITEAERQQIRSQYEYDWNNWPAAWGAPYEDTNHDGQYDPAVDVPGHPGADQTLWIVANDLGPGVSETLYGSPPIGIEYQLTLWGTDAPADAPAGNVSYMHARLIYTGRPDSPPDARIDSMYVTHWADPDVGAVEDDFGGCDSTRSLAYAYNARQYDQTYEALGLGTPAVGWDLLSGPVVDDGAAPVATACFVHASGSTLADPDIGVYEGSLQWYNFMRGLQPRPEYPAGNPILDPSGRQTRFVFSGDPLIGTGWVDGMDFPNGDRRLWITTGPFTMELGDTVDVVVAQIAALEEDNFSSLRQLIEYDRWVQSTFDSGTPTGVEPVAEHPAGVSGMRLTNYPNPFASSTTVSLGLDAPQRVRIGVYDLLGREVAVLHDGFLSANSEHRFTFAAANLPSGMYIVQAVGKSGAVQIPVLLV